MFAGEHVLVTGGSGFIGRTIVPALLADGARVTVADRVAYPDPDVPTVQGDLCDPSVRDAAVTSDLTGIVHLAAVTSVLGSLADPALVHETNVNVTAGLLELSRRRGVKRFVMASTNAVTGDIGTGTIHEGMPLRPLTPYGATKAAAEMLLSGYGGGYGMITCALRLTNVYGPGMELKDSFVPRLMRAAKNNTAVQVYGDGMQRRDLVHVDDVVAGLRVAWGARARRPADHRLRPVHHGARHRRRRRTGRRLEDHDRTRTAEARRDAGGDRVDRRRPCARLPADRRSRFRSRDGLGRSAPSWETHSGARHMDVRPPALDLLADPRGRSRAADHRRDRLPAGDPLRRLGHDLPEPPAEPHLPYANAPSPDPLGYNMLLLQPLLAIGNLITSRSCSTCSGSRWRWRSTRCCPPGRLAVAGRARDRAGAARRVPARDRAHHHVGHALRGAARRRVRGTRLERTAGPARDRARRPVPRRGAVTVRVGRRAADRDLRHLR